MNRYTFYIALFLFFTILNFDALSKGYFKPGYVVFNSGDTITGFVDYEKWDINPESFVFALRLGDVGKTLFLKDILSFSVEGRIYERGVVAIDKSLDKTVYLTNSGTLSMEIDTIFLQALIMGNKNLYYLKENSGKEHFFIKLDKGFQTLEYKRYIAKSGGKTKKTANVSYRDQLNSYLSNCSILDKEISSLEYTRISMITFYKQYYECTGSIPEYIYELSYVDFELALIGGFSLTYLNFVGDNIAYKHLFDADFSVSKDIAFGVSFNAKLPHKKRGIWAIYNELLYTSYNVSSYNYYPLNDDSYRSNYNEFGLSYINWDLLLRYYLPIKTGSFYVNGGIGLGYLLSETNYRKIVTQYTNLIIKETYAVKGFRDFENIYIFGLGYNLNRFSIEFRYVKGNGMTSQYNLGSDTRRLFALLSFNIL